MARLLETPDPIELKGRIKWFKLIRLFIFNIFRFAYLIYVLYTMFHHIDGIYRRVTIATCFISNMVATCFGTKILRIYKESFFKTLMLVLIFCLIIHHYFFLVFNEEETLLMKIVSDVIALIFLLFQTIPLLVQLLEFKYAVFCKIEEIKNNVRDYNRYYDMMIRAEENAGFMTEMECFLRSAPLQILQVALFFYNHGDFKNFSILQQIFILVPFLTMSFFITSFQSIVKNQKYEKEMTWSSKVFYFSAIFCTLGSIVINIGSAMAFWPICTLLVVLVHWIGATIWVYTQTKTQRVSMGFFGENKYFYGLICLVFGEIFVFKPINLGEKSSRWRYTCFYGIALIENTIASVVWWICEQKMSQSEKITVLSISHGLFVLGIVLMVFYYKKCHLKEQQMEKSSNVEEIPLESFVSPSTE